MRTYSLAEAPRPSYRRGLAYKGLAMLAGASLYAWLGYLLFADMPALWP